MGRETRRIDFSPDAKSGPGRAPLPPKRPTVGVDTGLWDDDEFGGAAGVREPRRPLPLGPMSGAGELPLPEPPVHLRLADARR
jgi:hypothetical protein